MPDEDPRRSLFDALGSVGKLGELWGTCSDGDVDGKTGCLGPGNLKFKPGGVDRNDDDDDDDVRSLPETTEPDCLDA